MNPALKSAAAVALFGMLSACGTSNIENMDVRGSSFDRGLYQGYLDLAKAEYDEDDWADGAAFSDRAKASAMGNAPQPEAISARKLPGSTVGALTDARSRLVVALSANATSKLPADAAEAQVMFDCWMQEQEENIQSDDIAKCRSRFEAAMARIDAGMKQATPKPAPRKAPEPGTTDFAIYFGFDSAKLDQKAMNGIEILKDDIKPNAKITVSGFADRAGAADYNDVLATKRVNAVVDALRAAGIRNEIDSEIYGEDQNAVPTGDGKKERLNRRVEISVTQ